MAHRSQSAMEVTGAQREGLHLRDGPDGAGGGGEGSAWAGVERPGEELLAPEVAGAERDYM